ncbi:PstS family phosphate ABC transporter substrate-binding protein [Pedobacter sp. MW01-1-1]|uniref:PstS family phosphate ABC transporter substrate-binding protein n=1 Tax=Pedobacter sp. MW01-1-1 TaxID=3383027 RepID=UPI003FEE98BB
MKKLTFLLLSVVALSACKQKKQQDNQVAETRTSGTLKMLVDESFGPVIEKQQEIFNLDYPDAHFTVVQGNEGKILPPFLNDSIRVIVLSRQLTPQEEKRYTNKGIKVHASRFAIDGIALITNADNIDSTINVNEIIDVFKGKPTTKKFVFDNPYSSTIRYFKDLAKVSALPDQGIYTQSNSNDVIKYIASNKNYIGVVGLNWLSEKNIAVQDALPKIKILGVKNSKGKKGDDKFYKPEQNNLINGVYPLYRNVYFIDCEGRDGLGTGFANWLMGDRGQLIVLKSGLAPNILNPREISLRTK